MNYIKTPVGIYDLQHSMYYYFQGIIVRMMNCIEYEINPASCKTADTIEDLCNCYIGTRTELIPFQYLNLEYAKNELEMEMINDIYGATWVINKNGVPTLKPIAKYDKEEKKLVLI